MDSTKSGFSHRWIVLLLSVIGAQVVAATVQQTAAGMAAAVPGTAARSCSVSAFEVPEGAVIEKVQKLSSVVEYCRVDGYLTTTKQSRNHVNFMVALPNNWNGRYLLVVPGGSAGYVVNPSKEHLSAGYAVATTDKGSGSKGMLDMSFRKDDDARLDYSYRGVHGVAQVTQALVKRYYERHSVPRYIMGCSGGGLSTLIEAERYAHDADAFIAAAEPTNAYVQTFWALLAQHVHENPKRWISETEMEQVGKLIMQDYDAFDGAVDGVIHNPRVIQLRRDRFKFLSDEQFSTLELLAKGIDFRDVVDGMRSPGFWMSNPVALVPTMLGRAAHWDKTTAPLLYSSVDSTLRAVVSPTFDLLVSGDYSSPSGLAAEKALWDRIGGYELDPENLVELQKSGGKLLMWTGAADDAIPPAYQADYSDQVGKLYGKNGESFFRSYFIPGMFHCRGGEQSPMNTGSKLLEAAQDWVEKGIAPDSLTLSNEPREIEVMTTSNTSRFTAGMASSAPESGKKTPGHSNRTYRICAYPKWPVFNGDKSDAAAIRQAENWQCR